LLSLASSPGDFGNALVRAKDDLRYDDLSQTSALLNGLTDYVEEIPEAKAQNIISALFSVGDELINPEDRRAQFVMGNTRLAARLIGNLLERIHENRMQFLQYAIENSQAIAVGGCLLASLQSEPLSPTDATRTPLLSPDEIEKLCGVWADRVNLLSSEAKFSKHPELWRILPLWGKWCQDDKPKSWCEDAIHSNEGLFSYLISLLWKSPRETERGETIESFHRLNPKNLEDLIDIDAIAGRLKRLDDSDDVPDEAKDAVSQYLREYQIIQNGENPDDHFEDCHEIKNAR